MCSSKTNDFDDWRDLNKLREEVEAQKARVESLQSAEKWMKNSFSASDLCAKTRLDRSDSGIDRQSLLMEGRKEDSMTNVLNQDCSTSSIKKIIEITSLIRAIEQQLNVSTDCADSQSTKTYSSTCSMPRCVHESPEQDYSSTSWIHSQLMVSLIEQEKLNKQLSNYHNQIFKIENVKIPMLLNGITTEQLKKRIDEYYKLKTCLTDLAKSSSCNSTAMITVVKQLEPIAQSVEHYFRLSQEVKYIQNQINLLTQRKGSLQNKRCQLLKILQIPSNQKHRNDILPQSASWNEPSAYILNAQNNGTYIQRNEVSHVSCDNCSKSTQKKEPEEEMKQCLKEICWPPFNGDGISEENPPPYDESLIHFEKKNKCHSRSLCHEYVNDDVIQSREYRKLEQSIDLIISSFPYESIAIVQVKGFKLNQSLHTNQQYRARLLQLNGEGSDWNPICSRDDGEHIFMNPHITLPISWSFNSYSTLSLLLELQMFEKGLASTSNCFIFNIVPLSTIQKISVPLHTVQNWITNSGNIGSLFTDQNRIGSLKIPQKSSIYDDIVLSNIQSGMHLLTNPIINRSSPPVHYSNIRRSQTYSHDHQYCGNYECCSSIDFVSEPVPRINPKYFSQAFNPPRPYRNQSIEPQSPENATLFSNSSSFKRQSIFRQPIRLKRNLSDRDIDSDQNSQISDHKHSDLLIQDLRSVVCDLYLALNSASSIDERLLEFAYFKTRCPPNLMKLYNYFVETIFDPDQK